MCSRVLLACMPVHHIHGVPVGSLKEFPGTGVTNGWALPCGGWESDLGPLEKQPALALNH